MEAQEKSRAEWGQAVLAEKRHKETIAAILLAPLLREAMNAYSHDKWDKVKEAASAAIRTADILISKTR